MRVITHVCQVWLGCFDILLVFHHDVPLYLIQIDHQERTSRYIARLGKELVKTLFSKGDAMDIVDLSLLKSKERDHLEGAFKYWGCNSPCKSELFRVWMPISSRNITTFLRSADSFWCSQWFKSCFCVFFSATTEGFMITNGSYERRWPDTFVDIRTSLSALHHGDSALYSLHLF